MEPIYFTLFALLGLAVGSFLNVCIDRLPEHKSLLSPPSHCPSCQRRLAVKDLVPVFSFLWLRGRCRYCGAAIPRRVLFVEITAGVIFALLYWRYGLSVPLAITIFYSCLFLVLFVIDLEHGLILNIIVYPSMGIAAVIAIFRTEPGIARAVLGGAIGLALFWSIVILSRGGMGWGDVKMAGLIGLITGFPRVFLALFIAIMIGGLAAVVLLLFKIKKRKEGIPFGPFLALGAVATVLFGNTLLLWYLHAIYYPG